MNYRTTVGILLGSLVACGGATTPISGGSDAGAPRGPLGPAGTFLADGGGGPGVNAHPGGTTSDLPCGTATCAIPSESCCVIDTGNGLSYSCVAGAVCPSPDAVGSPASSSGGGTGNNNVMDTTVVTLQCGATANCPEGTVCCAQSTNNATSSACKQTCNASEIQLCDPSATTTGCAPSQPCTTSNASDLGLPRSFGTCGEGGAAN